MYYTIEELLNEVDLPKVAWADYQYLTDREIEVRRAFMERSERIGIEEFNQDRETERQAWIGIVAKLLYANRITHNKVTL